MNELVTQTGTILGQAAELLKIPAIGGADTGLFTWLGNVFTKRSAKERDLSFFSKTNTVLVSGTGHITAVDINKSTITINR